MAMPIHMAMSRVPGGGMQLTSWLHWHEANLLCDDTLSGCFAVRDHMFGAWCLPISQGPRCVIHDAISGWTSRGKVYDHPQLHIPVDVKQQCIPHTMPFHKPFTHCSHVLPPRPHLSPCPQPPPLTHTLSNDCIIMHTHGLNPRCRLSVVLGCCLLARPQTLHPMH